MSAYVPAPSSDAYSLADEDANEIPSNHLEDDILVIRDDTFGIFARGRDFEPLNITHKYTEEEKKRLANYDSQDYLPSNSEIYRNWLKKQGSSKYNLGRWTIMGLIGFCVGLLGFLLHDLIEEIAKLKWSIAQDFIQEGDSGVAFLVAVGFSVVFALFSSFLVVFLRPSAGGSGIPEVTGFLNGTMLRHIFNIKTLVVKFLSCVAAVGCGLPVGPEGPMIHMGALVGAGLSQFKSQTMGFTIPIFSRYRTSEDRRNFISAGVAAGVASAFGSPVGGLLFSMEEVSSFWTITLSWQIFFCCMVSTFTTDLFNSAFNGFKYTGSFGQFKTERYIMFHINKGIDINILMFIPTVIIGIVGGLLGAAFTILNLKITRSRRRLLASFQEHVIVQKLFKVFEPAFIVVIVTVVAVFLPSAFACTKPTCIQGYLGDPVEGCVNDTRNPLHVERAVVHYTCDRGHVWKEGNSSLTNSTYNELATLMFGTLESAVKHLFSRDTHLQFGYASLLTVLAFNFFMICWSTATSVACGALVPMLLVGGLYGRMIGMLMTSMFGVHSEDTGYWAWMDPGAFALIGAASFFGGVTRLNLAVTVIMMELTNDVQVLLPVMVSVMISKWVGDFFTHPVYHALMELKCIPYLDSEPRVTIEKEKVNLELYMAKDIMSSPVDTIDVLSSVPEIAKLLLSSKHCGFPVVKKEADGQKTFYGLITRLELSVVMSKEVLFVSGDQVERHYDESSPAWIEYEEINVFKMRDPHGVKALLKKYITDGTYENKYINIERFTNQSAMSITETFSVQRTYIIFRTLGLRHLTVVDSRNHVTGIITRKDLMGFSVEEKLINVLSHKLHHNAVARQSPSNHGDSHGNNIVLDSVDEPANRNSVV